MPVCLYVFVNANSTNQSRLVTTLPFDSVKPDFAQKRQYLDGIPIIPAYRLTLINTCYIFCGIHCKMHIDLLTYLPRGAGSSSSALMPRSPLAERSPAFTPLSTMFKKFCTTKQCWLRYFKANKKIQSLRAGKISLP